MHKAPEREVNRTAKNVPSRLLHLMGNGIVSDLGAGQLWKDLSVEVIYKLYLTMRSDRENLKEVCSRQMEQ